MPARSSTGRRRRGPRREGTAGVPRSGGLRTWLSCVFAPDTATAGGRRGLGLGRTCGSRPFLPRSTRFGRSAIPPSRPRRRGIHDRRGPVDLAPGARLGQDRPVQSTPQPRPRPRREPAVCRRGRDGERLRRTPPGTPAGQHVHHRREHAALVERRGPADLRTGGERRQQRAASSHRPSGTSRCERSTLTKRHHAAARCAARRAGRTSGPRPTSESTGRPWTAGGPGSSRYASTACMTSRARAARPRSSSTRSRRSSWTPGVGPGPGPALVTGLDGPAHRSVAIDDRADLEVVRP